MSGTGSKSFFEKTEYLLKWMYMNHSSLPEIVTELRRRRHDDSTFLIGIEGFGGSGKSTFAASLKEALDSAFVVNIDDFIVKERITDSSWDKGAFDRKRLEAQVLILASGNKQVIYQRLIWDTNTLSETIIVPKVDYLIVEGISSFHPDIAHYYDYKIWIDTPIEVARERGRARDGDNENAQHWDLWAANDLAYQKSFHPELVADSVVSGV
jgi:uridine kinase